MTLKKRTYTTKEFLTDMFLLAGFVGLPMTLMVTAFKQCDTADHKNVVVNVKENAKNKTTEILLRDVETGAEHGFTELYDTRHLSQYLYSGDTVSIQASSSVYDSRSILSSEIAHLKYSPDSIRARQERETLAKYKSNLAKQR